MSSAALETRDLGRSKGMTKTSLSVHITALRRTSLTASIVTQDSSSLWIRPTLSAERPRRRLTPVA